MADVAEILRLMNHAADRLAEEDIRIGNAFAELVRSGVSNASKDRASAAAASAYAQTVLRLVASFLTETETTDA